MEESVDVQRGGVRYAEIPAWTLLSAIGNGPGIFGDIGGLGVLASKEIAEASQWTHVMTSENKDTCRWAVKEGIRFAHQRAPWDLPFGQNYVKAALLRLPDLPRRPRNVESLEELSRVVQPEGVVVVSTPWGGLQEKRLCELLERHQFSVSSVLQVRNGIVSDVHSTDDPIFAVAKAKWRPWTR